MMSNQTKPVIFAATIAAIVIALGYYAFSIVALNAPESFFETYMALLLPAALIIAVVSILARVLPNPPQWMFFLAVAAIALWVPLAMDQWLFNVYWQSTSHITIVAVWVILFAVAFALREVDQKEWLYGAAMLATWASILVYVGVRASGYHWEPMADIAFGVLWIITSMVVIASEADNRAYPVFCYTILLLLGCVAVAYGLM